MERVGYRRWKIADNRSFREHLRAVVKKFQPGFGLESALSHCRYTVQRIAFYNKFRVETLGECTHSGFLCSSLVGLLLCSFFPSGKNCSVLVV